jgi:uncharacterized protein (TIGR04255 family)
VSGVTKVLDMSALDIFAGPLPEFERPPVIEVAVGLEFLPLDALNTVELVRLHDRWSADFPEIRLQPELPSASQMAFQIPMVFGTGVPPVRLWSLTPDENLLIQVQADRIFFNWRYTVGDTSYPRYSALEEQFARRWEQLLSHLSDLASPAPQVTVAEVTYVNRIDLIDSSDPADILTFIRDEPFLWPLQAMRVQRDSVFPEETGWVGSLVLRAGNVEPKVLNLDVVTRVSLTEGAQSPSSVMEALEFAHQVGVRSFAAATTQRMHKVWGRRV